MEKESKKIKSQISEMGSHLSLSEIGTSLGFDEPISVIVVMPNEAEYTIHDVKQIQTFSVHNGCFGFVISQADGGTTIVPPGYSIINFLPKV